MAPHFTVYSFDSLEEDDTDSESISDKENDKIMSSSNISNIK